MAELVEVAVKAYELKSVSEVKSVQVTILVTTEMFQANHTRSFLKLKPDSTKSFQEMLDVDHSHIGSQRKELEEVELILN